MLPSQVNDLRSKLETLENERDFYFDKLRDIEILCQWPEIAKLPVGHSYWVKEII